MFALIAGTGLSLAWRYRRTTRLQGIVVVRAAALLLIGVWLETQMYGSDPPVLRRLLPPRAPRRSGSVSAACSPSPRRASCSGHCSSPSSCAAGPSRSATAPTGFRGARRSRGPAPGADRRRPLPRGRVVRVLLPRHGDRSAGPRRSAVDRTPGRGRPRGGWPRDLRRVDRGPHLPPESPRVVAPLERHGPLRVGRRGRSPQLGSPWGSPAPCSGSPPGSAHASLASRRSSRSARWR